MDTDKIKVFGSRVRVESVAKVAELELAEKEKMAEKVIRMFHFVFFICLVRLVQSNELYNSIIFKYNLRWI